MNDAEFRHLLESCTTLNDKQRTILHNMVSHALICGGKILKLVLPDIFAPPRWFVQMLLLSIVAKHLGFAISGCCRANSTKRCFSSSAYQCTQH